MGGTGSGRYYRWNKKSTLDDYRNLDVNRLVKHGVIREGTIKHGSWQWMDTVTKEVKSSIGYESNTVCDSPYIRLHYSWTESKESFDYKIRLSKTPVNFGGFRYWFHCPETNKRVGKLFLIPSDGRFISRHVYKIYYASQMESDLDRMISKRHKIESKLSDPYYIKPKGMHQKTFDRLIEEYDHYDTMSACLMMERFKPLRDKYLNK